jgi:isoleucyl-tRNA synthetase
VLWKITEALVRLLAPILSFTADEVWDYLPVVEGREVSVHLALFPTPESIYPEDPAPLLAEWKQLFAVRNLALIELEGERQAQRIGKGLEADLEVLPRAKATGSKHSDLAQFSEIKPVPASGSKCARCWNFMPEVSNYGVWENVCTRCHKALSTMGIEAPAEGEVIA